MAEDIAKEFDQEEKRQETSKSTAPRSKSIYPLPDVNLGFEFQLKILNACVVTSDYGKRDSNLEQVQNNLINKSEALGNGITFLVSIGLLTGDRNNFRPTDEAVDFIYARKDGNEVDAKSILAGVVGKAWFTESVKQLIEVKGPVSETELINKMARDCRVDPDKRERSFKSLIDYLRYTAIITEQEDKKLTIGSVTVRNAGDGKPKLTTIASSSSPESGENGTGSGRQDQAIQSRAMSAEFEINLNFEISSDTDVEKVRQIIRAIKEELTNNNDGK